jgi:hypothetical protein
MPSTAAGAPGSRRIPHYNRDEWTWPGYIPTPGVTVMVGSIKAATSLVAIKIAATVASGSAWPDHTYAARGEVVWVTAQHGTTIALRERLAAAGAVRALSWFELSSPSWMTSGCRFTISAATCSALSVNSRAPTR